MSSAKVIVFGPTGAVGSSAAAHAGELGAHVSLAMRDVKKSIDGLDESKGTYHRVHADLTDPDTVRAAVKDTGATHAFIYLIHTSTDGMRATIEALKEAGIQLVVFLSSYTVRGDLKATPSSDYIAWAHAQVELNLQAVFGHAFVALRPGYFTSNTMMYANDIRSGTVKLFGPQAIVDGIVPADIGRVAGTILAKGPQDDNQIIFLYGTELMPVSQALKTIGTAAGKEVNVEKVSADEAYEDLTKNRQMPPPIAKYFVGDQQFEGLDREGYTQVMGISIEPEDMKNVQKYSGTKPTTFKEWAEQNKQAFT